MRKFGAAVSCKIPKEALSKLEKICERVFLLPPDERIAPPVSHHPDMILTVIGEKLFCHKSYFEKNKELLFDICNEFSLTPVTSECRREEKYPYDIAFNVLNTGGFIFGNTEFTAPEVLKAANEAGLGIVSIKQGYAACSTLLAGDTVITSDPSVVNAVKSKNLSFFKIQPGGISLEPYDTGFIGGASGYFDGHVFTIGKFSSDERFRELEKFLKEKNICIIPLCETPLTDFGGIKFFEI